MQKLNLKKGYFIFFIIYVILVTSFYFIAGEQLYFRDSKNTITSPIGEQATEEITSDYTVQQNFISNIDQLSGFSIQFATFARINTGNLHITLKDLTTGSLVFQKKVNISNIKDNEFISFNLEQPCDNSKGHIFQISLTAPNASTGNAIAPWYNSKLQTNDNQLFFNGKKVEGQLCFNTIGQDHVWTGPNYWKIVVCFTFIIILYCIWMSYCHRKQKFCIVLNIVYILKKYRFLIEQLVSRDFKVKYKRSVLGTLWSFLNPLLTMLVQYMVFSTLFKSDISYYPVYLLTGIVFYGFFSESTNSSLYSIVGNASLITKVYVPKYIYPVSKVLSSTVNLLLSLVPLFIMIIVNRVPITKAYLLLLFILPIFLIFCIGIGFILSALMVFFRDVQFIWSVLSLLWMYATPIFYPEDILPSQFSFIHKYNPLYHIIKFTRIILIDGISPEPMMYVKCLMFSLVFLIIGILIFKKTQNKFVLYI